MDLLPLEHFIAVVEERSFSRAAEKVFRTQPAVSQSIKKLEDEIGTPLFARDGPELALTKAGKVLLDYARRMLSLRDEAFHDLAQLESLNAGTVAIAAHESAAFYLLPSALRDYAKKFPRIKIELHCSPISEIPEKVLDREVDLGFVVEKPAFHELRSVPVFSDVLILIAPANHPLAWQRTVCFKDLEQEPLVVHNRCKSTSGMTMQLFRRNNIPFRVAVELSSFECMKSFVQQGVGLAILPRLAALRELREGTLVEIPLQGLDIQRRTFLISRDKRYLSHPAQELRKLVRASVNAGSCSEARRDETLPAPLHDPRRRIAH